MTHWRRPILFDPDPGEGGGGNPPASSSDVSFGGGKFKNPEALETGYNNLRENMGLEKVDALVGEKGQYRDHLALDRAYLDLEKLQGSRKPAEKPGETKPPVDSGKLDIETHAGDDDSIDVPTIIERSGLKLEDLESQWNEHGALTDEQYAAIRKADPSLKNVSKGVLKAMVDQAAKGMILEAEAVSQARAQLHGKLAEKLGVEPSKLVDTLRTMGASVPAGEREAINKALNDSSLAELAVEKIIAYHRNANGAGGSKPAIPGDAGNAPAGIRTFEDLSTASRRSNEGDMNAARSIGAMRTEDILQHGRF